MADRNMVLQLLITAKDQASAALQRIRTSVADMGEAVSRVLEPLRTFGGLLATAAGIGSAKELVDRADAYTRISNSLKIATSNEQEYQAALKDVAAIASRTNADIETTAQLYGKVAQSAKELGLSQQQIGQLTEVISKGMQLSGASAETASGAILQLTQAFGSGALRGEEFNSVMEASPELMRQLAAGLGVTIGELRGMAEQGVLTSRVVSAALLSQKDAIDKAYGETTRTVGQAFTNLNNQLILYVGKLNESTGATKTIGATLGLLADNLNIVAAAAGAGLVTAFARSTQALVGYVKESIAARAAAHDHAIAAAAQREAAIAAAQGNVAAAQAAVNRAIAEQRAAQATLQAAIGDEALARAHIAASSAAQAATAATNRYISAQSALNAAQVASSTGAGLLSRAMGFLAGPGGLILLAISAFGALLPLLSKSKTNLDELTVSTDQYRDSIKSLNNIQLFANIQQLNDAIRDQENVIADAEAVVNKLRDGHRNLFEVMKDGRPVAVQLTEAEGTLADARQKLNKLQDNLKVSTEALIVARRQEDADLGKQLVRYQQIVLAMQNYSKDLDALGKQQREIATANQERIKAEIDLAKASGDVQASDRLTLTLAASRAIAAKQQAELDKAAAVATNLKLDAIQKEYNLLSEKQPKDEENLRLAKQDAELKNAQAAASNALADNLQQQAKNTDELSQQTQVLETQLEGLRTETELGITLAEQWSNVQKQEIENALNLAKARGDEATAAQLSAKATQQEVIAAKERIDQLGIQRAEIDKHIQKLYEQYNADQDYTDAERNTIEVLKEKSSALGADSAQIEAHLPSMEREAQQAAIMAGPIGQLIRLYAEQTTEHERAAAASERYYATQIQQVDAEIRVAQAKGDEAEAADLLQKKQQLLLDQADAMAAAAQQAAVDAQNKVDAYTLEASASEGVSQAEQEQIDKLQEVADAKKAAAAQAVIHAEALRKEQDAANRSASAFDNAAQNAYKFSDAAGDVAKRNAEVGKSAEDAGNQTKKLTASYIQFRDESATAIGGGMFGFKRIWEEINDSINEANIAAQRLAKEGISAADWNTEQLAKDLLEAKGALSDAAHTAGQNLVQALQRARAEAQGLAEDMAAMADDFQKEILQIQGDQQKLLDLEYNERKKKLDEMHALAGRYGDDEYNSAVAALNSLQALKLQKLNEEAKARNDDTANAVGAATAVKGAWSGAADEIERAGRAASMVGRADLSKLNNQLGDARLAAIALKNAL